MSPFSLVLAFAVLIASGVVHAADPGEVYKTQCAKCHGDTGNADTPAGKALKVPPLAGDAQVAGAPQADLVKAIRENKKHAAFVTRLGDAEVEAGATKAKELAGAK